MEGLEPALSHPAEGWRAQSRAEEQRSCWRGWGAPAPSRGRAPAEAHGGDRSHQREAVSLVCGTSPQHTAQAVKQVIKWSDIFVVSVTLEIKVEFSVIKVTPRTGPSHPTSSVRILVYQMGRQFLGDFLAVLSKCEISWQINTPSAGTADSWGKQPWEHSLVPALPTSQGQRRGLAPRWPCLERGSARPPPSVLVGSQETGQPKPQLFVPTPLGSLLGRVL